MIQSLLLALASNILSFLPAEIEIFLLTLENFKPINLVEHLHLLLRSNKSQRLNRESDGAEREREERLISAQSSPRMSVRVSPGQIGGEAMTGNEQFIGSVKPSEEKQASQHGNSTGLIL